MRRSRIALGCLGIHVLLLALASACASGGSDDASGGFATPGVSAPAPPLSIEESDLYRLQGSWLYVQSTHTGLNVIDVAEPLAPRLAHRVPITGRAGELYIDADTAFLLLEEASPPCRLGQGFQGALIATTSQLVAVDRVTSAPELSSPVCLPGQIIGSRKIGDFVYVITSYEPLDLTWALAIDVSDPAAPVLGDVVVMEGAASEIHVTEEAIYVAQMGAVLGSSETQLRYISLEPVSGALTERGSIALSGEPAGRFHMDAAGDTFRIVTRGEFGAGSNLHVVDFADPDRPKRLGSLTGIAPREDLHATRFEGDRAYIVTYESLILQRDPLWVVSLADPSAPAILGHLEIPGWSDYVFPRGQQLVAVGRGDRGSQVAVSLFDVSDPSAPAELSRVAFGDDRASSEANTDFRAARIIDEPGTPGLVVVPYTNNVIQANGCTPEGYVQLVDLGERELTLRGNSSPHHGSVLRTLPIGGRLYALGQREIRAFDITNRDALQVTAMLDMAGSAGPEQCVFTTQMFAGGFADDEVGYACQASPGRVAGAGAGIFGSLCLLGLGWARRRRLLG
jgi:hypothetical protein